MSSTDGTVLHCLADPTRRAIIEELRKAPASVGEVATRLPVSRPAVSQHLKVLQQAGLVSQERRGAQRIFRIDVAGLVEVRRYLDALWADALSALEDAGDGVDVALSAPGARADPEEEP
ncbi:MAG: metalloregulator ArsR/SmtB family transcription factor [Pseudomonadota bacterium]